MTRATVVRYRTRPDTADENERLVRGVFEELAITQPDGLRYSSYRVDDTTFVHVAVFEGEGNPLDSVAAFHTFVAELGARCAEGPLPLHGRVVGSYP